MRRRRAAIGVVAACLLSCAVAAAEAPADDERAASAFAAGERAFEAGDYRRAAAEFEAAYHAKPHHAPLWNAARSWAKAGDDVRSANLLERYLREAPEGAPDRDHATTALAELAHRLARVEIAAANVGDVRLDGAAIDGAVVYVAPGEHVATADASGKPVRKLLRVLGGDVVSVTLEPPDAPPPESIVTREVPPPIAPRRGLSPWYVAGGGALTAVGGALAIAFGLTTVSKRDAFLADPTDSRLDDARASQTRTNVALGATVGLAIVTGVVAAFFVEWRGAVRSAP